MFLSHKGEPYVTVKESAGVLDRPSGLRTVILTVPVAAKSEAGINGIKVVALTKLATWSAALATATTPLLNPVPVMVMAAPGVPWAIEEGAREAVVGTARVCPGGALVEPMAKRVLAQFKNPWSPATDLGQAAKWFENCGLVGSTVGTTNGVGPFIKISFGVAALVDRARLAGAAAWFGVDRWAPRQWLFPLDECRNCLRSSGIETLNLDLEFARSFFSPDMQRFGGMWTFGDWANLPSTLKGI